MRTAEAVVEPTDDELIAFADAVLSDFGDELRERSVLSQAITDNRDVWVLLYEISRDE